MSVAGGVIGLTHPNVAIALLLSTLLESTHVAPREKIGHLVEQRTTFRDSLPRTPIFRHEARSGRVVE